MKDFNLKEAIAVWKKSLWAEQGLEPGVIEELEANLYDRIDEYLEEDYSEEEAFQKAIKKAMPTTRELANEFYKAGNQKQSKPPWQRNRYVWNRMPMHLKVAIRNFARRKVYTLLNIGGLAVSLCTAALIWFYVQDQSSYDQHYKNAERIYRVNYDVTLSGERVPQADVGQPVGPTLKANFPQVEEFGRIRRIGASNTLETELFKLESTDIFVADTSFLNVFSVPFSNGDRKTALDEPNTIVISESLALLLFGETKVVGRTIRYSGVKPPMNIKVTGVFPDLDRHTHFPFKALVSYGTYFEPSDLANWLRKSYTFIRLDPSNDIKSVESKMPGFSVKYLKPVFEPLGGEAKLIFQPLASIYLDDDGFGGPYPLGNKADLQILAAIMVFLLAMSCMNYVNMATARSVDRALEVGIKKTLGSSQVSLMMQFMIEAMLLALVAFLIAMILSVVLFKPYAYITGLDLALRQFLKAENLLRFWGLALLVGVVSGIYPALYLSRFKPGTVLKGKFATGTKGFLLRKSLIILQYAISSVLITGIIVVALQTHFIKNKDIGYTKEGLIVIPMPDDISINHKAYNFIDQVRLMPRIRSAALARNGMDGYHMAGGLEVNYAKTGPVKVALSYIYVGQEFVKTIDAEMVDGRGFSSDFNNEFTFLINETAVEQYGWEAYDQLKWQGWNKDENWQCIGVVKDFNLGESYREHKPMMLLHNNYPNIDSKIYIGIANQNLSGTLLDIQTIWEDQFPGHAFDYLFVEDQLNELYKGEDLFLELASILGIIILFVTVVGIVGLISFTTELRRKEIALRKVSGASIQNILTLLSRQFLKLLLLATMVAIPLAYWLSDSWLNNFALRIDISAWTLLLALPICLLLTGLSVGYHSLKAARSNPVNALRME